MGEYLQTIVDRDASASEAVYLANKVHRWLVKKGIVSSSSNENTSDPFHGFPPGPKADLAFQISHPDVVQVQPDNVMSIVTEKTVFYSMAGWSELICQNCFHRFKQNDACLEAVGAWYSGMAERNLACPSCKHLQAIENWEHDPAWGFGYLGFTFWNWPWLSDSFIQEVAKFLDHRVVRVYGKL